jgi:hypothetical protein
MGPDEIGRAAKVSLEREAIRDLIAERVSVRRWSRIDPGR